MRTTTLVVTFILSVSGLSTAQEFAEFVSTRDGFTIDFPGQPTVAGTTWKSQQNYELPARVYSVDRGREHYSVLVADYNGIETLARARVANCPTGTRVQCRGTDVSGTGLWKHDVREALLWATMKLIQRDNMKLSDLTWTQHDLVDGNQLQLTNTLDGSRTYAYVAMRELKLYIVEATVPRNSPPATLFQTSMGWVDKDGNGVRYTTPYNGALHGLGECAVPVLSGIAPSAQ